MREIELTEIGAHTVRGLPFEELGDDARIRVGKDLYTNIPRIVETNWAALQGKDAWVLVRASKFDYELSAVTSGVIAINIGKFDDPGRAMAIADALQKRIRFSEDKYEGLCVVSDVLLNPKFKPEAINPNLRERIHVWWDKPYERWKTRYEVTD